MCCFFLFQDIDQNGYDQNDTSDDLLPVCLQADIWKTCFQKHDDEDTNECTDHGTISTGSCYTTNEYTPSSALGSCRYKLADPDVDDTDYQRILDIFKKYNVRYFFYNGGNEIGRASCRERVLRLV